MHVLPLTALSLFFLYLLRVSGSPSGHWLMLLLLPPRGWGWGSDPGGSGFGIEPGLVLRGLN
eukprot:SAG22_NODE_12977_length_423_cov_0.700617_1_plen_61_part_01